MYGMYVHIKAVAYVTFPNKNDILRKLIFLSYVVPYVLIIIIIVSTSLNEQ